ncbi:MAG: ABC transporter ATP-binding protein [Phycisphaerae bacterium]
MIQPAIRVEGISKRYRIGARERSYQTFREALGETLFSPLRRMSQWMQPVPEAEMIWALQDVSFEVQPGEVVGIIGRNGAGKSTFLKVLSRITDPTHGFAEIRGRVGSLLEVGTGFHPELTGRENIFLNGAILGMRNKEIVRKFDGIVSFAEIEKFIDTPVKRYSSGMYMRLAFSVAAHLDPEILLVDEVLAVGDAGFQTKCLGKMGQVAKEGRTVLFVSHNMAAIQQLCSRAILLCGGKVFRMGGVESVISEYLAQSGNRERNSQGYLARNSSGTVELTSIEWIDHEGRRMSVGQCGRDLNIALSLKTTLPFERLSVSIGINNPYGIRLAVLHSKVAGYEFDLDSARHNVICRVPRLPLLPGRYLLDIKVIAGNEALLWEPQVVDLNVEGGDFHGTGRLAEPAWGGFFCMEQQWETRNGI